MNYRKTPYKELIKLYLSETDFNKRIILKNEIRKRERAIGIKTINSFDYKNAEEKIL